MQYGNGSISKSTQDFVDGIIKTDDPRRIELLCGIAELIRSAAREGAVSRTQNQEFQREFRTFDRRFLPEDFALLASGTESELRLRNLVVKLVPLADNILARTKRLLPRPPSVRPPSNHAKETPLPL